MENIAPINSAINSNKEIYQKLQSNPIKDNKAFLTQAYDIDRVEFYNAGENEKKAKKKKKNKLFGLAFAGITTLGIGTILVVDIAKGRYSKKMWDKLVHSKVGQETIKACDELANSKVGKETKKFFDKVINFSVNISNLKDDLWTRYTKDNKTLNKINEKLENVYHGFAKNKYKNAYNSSKEILDAAGLSKNIQNYDDWFDALKNSIRKKLNEGKRISEGLISDSKGKPIGERANSIWDKLTGEPLSEIKLKPLRKNLTTQNFEVGIVGIDNVIKKLNTEDTEKTFKELTQAVQDSINNGDIKLDNKSLSAEQIAKSIKEMNKIKTKGANDVYERIRDTALGNASTDVLGVLGALATLGGSLVTDDNKEERKSTLINLGIPLLITLASMFIGTAACFSGGIALVFGLATGQAASMGAKALDNGLKKHNGQKEQKQQLQLEA